jgi:hypothetical protein
MITKYDVDDKGACKSCGEDFPIIWEVPYEDQLRKHHCPNQGILAAKRFEMLMNEVVGINQRLDALQSGLDSMQAALNDDDWPDDDG